MLFNSFEFIFLFLPIVIIGYFFLNKLHTTSAKVWLLLASFFFYSWWNPDYFPLILTSLLVNYTVGTLLGKWENDFKRKALLTVGILFNVGLLGYYKYADFFLSNVNVFFQTNLPLLELALPLAISFYTFQQIAYLVDSYRNETKEYNFLNYSLFVAFFPQLIAGPIVHHGTVMPQFEEERNKRWISSNVALGIYVFGIGLFKKLIIADTFAIWANAGFSQPTALSFFDSWIVSLAYTFQLYFDFSGYSDMAIGAALLFNIKLPINFNSPYKALSIQDFWRRWHITLSTFLTNYLYIPLGGSRKGISRTYINILIIFAVSGIWHGAGWTFVIWGLLHGIASVIYRAWSRLGLSLPKLLAWFITFQFVNATWVFFRAESVQDALSILKSMSGLNGFTFPASLQGQMELFGLENYLPAEWSLAFLSDVPVNYVSSILTTGSLTALLCVAFGLLITLFLKNGMQLMDAFKPGFFNALFIACLYVFSIFHLQRVSEFLYFNF
ncbi:MBOAT family O-acyltransferase [Mangrovibacillus cuniculi]|uniref:MBOAT family protein n=1 Tax=Mangrovibacillus cuniculi TaxID=2593652 RepID=A0A7S8CCN4_9BACI|nr:MBOAT family O-acyltransferase [Mangrovibacillus cuniculi]QPC47545.1 MBOAT family protein [Mangrovibacillus cuniculi]